MPVYTQYSQPECGWPEDALQNMEEILADHNRMFGEAHRRGGLLMAGTDAGCPGVEMGEGLRRELACMANSGIAPAELLKMATVTNAELCGAQQYTGRIEVGSPASFGVYQDAPWDKIDNLNTLTSVYHGRCQIRSVAAVN